MFPLIAQDGGVLVRAGHTEACCDLARLAGLTPAAVLCEIMREDGTMARLPDLMEFAAQHKLKIGTIADLIEYRSRNESLVQRGQEREIETPWGRFRLVAYRDLPSGATHLALTLGNISIKDETLVRVHEPLSVLDLLDAGKGGHAWGVGEALTQIQRAGCGVMVLLNCSQSDEALQAQFDAHFTGQPPVRAGPQHGPAHLRHRRADPARPGRGQDAADGRAAQDAEHGRFRARSHRLRPRSVAAESANDRTPGSGSSIPASTRRSATRCSSRRARNLKARASTGAGIGQNSSRWPARWRSRSRCSGWRSPAASMRSSRSAR